MAGVVAHALVRAGDRADGRRIFNHGWKRSDALADGDSALQIYWYAMDVGTAAEADAIRGVAGDFPRFIVQI